MSDTALRGRRRPVPAGPLKPRARRPIRLPEMVHFARRRFGRAERLTVRTAPALRGHRIVVRHPDGRRVVHDFPDYSARYLGTVAIQAELLRDG